MNKKAKQKSLRFKVKLYHRWLRLYMRRIRQVEREIGGALDAC